MLRKQTNRLNQTIRGAVLAFVALAALVASADGARRQHRDDRDQASDARGCHSWSFNSGPFKPALSVSVSPGVPRRSRTTTSCPTS